MNAPAYRPPRLGDLLAVRSSDPALPEGQVVIDTVADDGTCLYFSGRWRETDLEVVVRRVGGSALPHQPLEY